MIFNSLTNKLFTDKGECIKQMYCQFKLNWDERIELKKNPGKRKCEYCDCLIMDTASMNDESLLTLIKQHPDSCLKIDLNQGNLINTHKC